MKPSDEFVELALGLPRKDFVAAYNFPFLVGANELIVRSDWQGDEDTRSGRETKPPKMAPAKGRPRVFPVRKSTTMLQHHITVGRALTSDVVLQAHEVSKLHAFFQTRRGGLELSDAGSRNGTWAGKQRLVPKGAALGVQSGDIITFGPFAFYYYDADACWECLHRWPRSR